MKLHEHRQAEMNLIQRYGAGQLHINDQTFSTPCIVAPGLLHHTWIGAIEQLTLEQLQPALALQPRIALLGTAAPPPAAVRALRTPLATRNVALEIMDLGAACRTYNVLAQEDRAVVALLFP
jgi:uncharacterized protein